jgi:hypothetical protein
VDSILYSAVIQFLLLSLQLLGSGSKHDNTDLGFYERIAARVIPAAPAPTMHKSHLSSALAGIDRESVINQLEPTSRVVSSSDADRS